MDDPKISMKFYLNYGTRRWVWEINKKHSLVLRVLHGSPYFLIQILFLHSFGTGHVPASELLMNTKIPTMGGLCFFLSN